MDRDQQLESLVVAARGSRLRMLALIEQVASWGPDAFAALERRIGRADFETQESASALLSAYWRVGTHDPTRTTRFIAEQPRAVRLLALEEPDRKLASLGAFAEACVGSPNEKEAELARQVVVWRLDRQRASSLGGAHAVVDAVLIGDYVPKGTCFVGREGTAEIVAFGAAAFDPLEHALEKIAVGGSSAYQCDPIVLAYWLVSVHDPHRALEFLARQPFFLRSLALDEGPIAFVKKNSGFFIGMHAHFEAFVASMRVFVRARCSLCRSEVDWSVGQHVSESGLVWWRSLDCACGAKQEEDGVGLPPEEIRSAILRAQGVFNVVVRPENHVLALAKLRQSWGWSIEEAARRIRGERSVWAGTELECWWISNELNGAALGARVEPS